MTQVILKHLDKVVISSNYQVGDLIKFQILRGNEVRISYSRIIKVLIRLDTDEFSKHDTRVKNYYITENAKKVEEEDILWLEAKAPNTEDRQPVLK